MQVWLENMFQKSVLLVFLKLSDNLVRNQRNCDLLKSPRYRNSPHKFKNLVEYIWECVFLYIGILFKLKLKM